LTAAFLAPSAQRPRPAPPVSLLLRIAPLLHSSLIQPLMPPPAIHHYLPLPPPPISLLSLPLSLSLALCCLSPRRAARLLPCYWYDLCPDSEILAGTGRSARFGLSFLRFQVLCLWDEWKEARLQKEVSFKLSSRFIPSSVGILMGLGSREDLGTCFPFPWLWNSASCTHRWKKRGGAILVTSNISDGSFCKEQRLFLFVGCLDLRERRSLHLFILGISASI